MEGEHAAAASRPQVPSRVPAWVERAEVGRRARLSWQVHTPFTTRAKELMELYNGLRLPFLSID